MAWAFTPHLGCRVLVALYLIWEILGGELGWCYGNAAAGEGGKGSFSWVDGVVRYGMCDDGVGMRVTFDLIRSWHWRVLI